MGDGGETLYRRPSLLASGYSDQELRALRRTGQLVTIRRGTYLAGPEPEFADQRHRIESRAVMRQLTTDIVLSHASAAIWHELPTWHVPLDKVQVARNRRSGGRVDPRLHLYTTPLDASEVALVDGVAVTSVARTVVDLARVVSFESAVVTADAALARGTVTRPELDAALTRCAGWPGAPNARRVIAFADGRSESVGESRSRVAIMRARLPPPELQFVIRDTSGLDLGRVDFLVAHGTRRRRVRRTHQIRPPTTVEPQPGRCRLRGEAARGPYPRACAHGRPLDLAGPRHLHHRTPHSTGSYTPPVAHTRAVTRV
jgi:hypothetical protein